MVAFLVAAATGVLTGAGIGGGTLLLLYLTGVQDIAQGAAQGINLSYYLATAAPALVGHIRKKRVAVKTVLPALVAALIGAGAGAALSAIIDADLLRRLFGVLWIAIGARELWKAFQKR